MGKVYVLKSVQHLPVSIEEAWRFFSDPNNLFAMTPPSLNLKLTNKLHFPEMYPGQIITYRVKPLLGIPLFWLTEITHVEENRFFVDEQRRGPYSLWHHQHHFVPVDGGVQMTDIVHYQLPFGPLGSMAQTVIVKKELHKIFTFRYQKIIELFGPWPGEQMQVSITAA